eukprot:7376015-Prymnesium_polylepis.1
MALALAGFASCAQHGGGIQFFSKSPAQLAVAAQGDNVCQQAGYPCFTPNAKDVNASSQLHTCGPVYDGLFGCQDLQIAGYKCFYNFTMYTCDQGHDPVHDGDSGEECTQGSFDSCNSLCTQLDSPYVLTCTNFCKREPRLGSNSRCTPDHASHRWASATLTLALLCCAQAPAKSSECSSLKREHTNARVTAAGRGGGRAGDSVFSLAQRATCSARLWRWVWFLRSACGGGL